MGVSSGAVGRCKVRNYFLHRQENRRKKVRIGARNVAKKTEQVQKNDTEIKKLA